MGPRARGGGACACALPFLSLLLSPLWGTEVEALRLAASVSPCVPQKVWVGVLGSCAPCPRCRVSICYTRALPLGLPGTHRLGGAL